jgi:hypothetical protein
MVKCCKYFGTEGVRRLRQIWLSFVTIIYRSKEKLVLFEVPDARASPKGREMLGRLRKCRFCWNTR